MTRFKTHLVGAIGALVAGGAVMAAAAPAAAYIVCNQYDECWHVHQHYTYPSDVRISVYDDDWSFPDAHYSWVPDRDDRGYYRHHHWFHF